MNQILSVENNNYQGKSSINNQKYKPNNNKGPAPLKTILIFFGIAIVLTGIFFIAKSGFDMYIASQNDAASQKPTIAVTQDTEETIKLKLEHPLGLAKITYSWNGEEEIEILANNKKIIEKLIDLPQGTNELKVVATDVNGGVSEYVQTYTVAGIININFEVDGTELVISADSTEEIAYITYRWEDEDETKIEVNDFELEYSIDIPVGTNILTVVAVDTNNEQVTKEQEVKGIKKPKIEITVSEEDAFIITITDELGLESIKLIGNETDVLEQELDGKKEVVYSYSLKEGENIIEVTATNIDGQNETANMKVTK